MISLIVPVKKYLPLFFILILGAILRFWQLGSVPFGVTHDEMGYIYNAFTIAKTGKNVFGQAFPFLTWMTPNGFPFMPVPIYLSAPFFWFLNISAFAGRLPSAILGIADILLLYIFVKQIFNKNSLAILSALFLSISPWHLHFSRSAYDTNFALFFYLFGMCLFFYEIKNKKIPIFSLASFLLAVFSYRGMSVIELPLLLTLLIYAKVLKKISKKQIMAFIVGIIIINSCLLFVSLKYGKSYTQEALFFNDPKSQEIVDANSRDAQGPLLLKRVFLNKLTYVLDKVRSNYVKSYSPEFLFLYTEPSGIYSIWSRGRIYFFDLFLIIIGLLYLYKSSTKNAVFILSLLAIGGLPGGVGGLPYSSRNFFLSLVFPIISGAGVLFFLENKGFAKIKFLVMLLLIVIYGFLLSSYLFDYYFRYAFFAGESWAKSLKDVSTVIGENRNKYKNIIVSEISFGDVVQYAFWNKLGATETQQIWQKSSSFSQPYKYKNIQFIEQCPKIFHIQNQENLLYITHYGCKVDSKPFNEIKDYFGNPIWDIYETPTH